MVHICKQCGEEKGVEEFTRKHKEGPYEPWNLRKCKVCVHEDYLSRASEKGAREQLKQTSRDWKSRNKERHAEINRRWNAVNRDRIRAGNKLRYAVRMNRIERSPCEVCGTTDRVHGHHDSYEKGKELDVRWLCQTHHKMWHVILDSVNDITDLDDRFISFVRSAS